MEIIGCVLDPDRRGRYPPLRCGSDSRSVGMARLPTPEAIEALSRNDQARFRETLAGFLGDGGAGGAGVPAYTKVANAELNIPWPSDSRSGRPSRSSSCGRRSSSYRFR